MSIGWAIVRLILFVFFGLDLKANTNRFVVEQNLVVSFQ